MYHVRCILFNPKRNKERNVYVVVVWREKYETGIRIEIKILWKDADTIVLWYGTYIIASASLALSVKVHNNQNTDESNLPSFSSFAALL